MSLQAGHLGGFGSPRQAQSKEFNLKFHLLFLQSSSFPWWQGWCRQGLDLHLLVAGPKTVSLARAFPPAAQFSFAQPDPCHLVDEDFRVSRVLAIPHSLQWGRGPFGAARSAQGIEPVLRVVSAPAADEYAGLPFIACDAS